jgi:hypothetical protein
LSVERGEKMRSLREGRGRGVGGSQSCDGRREPAADVLVPVLIQRHAYPPHPAMFAIGGRPRRGAEAGTPPLATDHVLSETRPVSDDRDTAEACTEHPSCIRGFIAKPK